MMFQGSDVFESRCNETEFFTLVNQHRLKIYDLTFHETLKFKAHRSQRALILEVLPGTTYRYTRGFMGQIERLFLNKERIFVLILMTGIWYLFSHTIFEIELLGESQTHQALIQQQLALHHAIPPFFLWDKASLQKQLTEDLIQDIHWLTIHQQGSHLEIHYLPKQPLHETTPNDIDLIAEKDGMIASFDVKSGYKQVTLHQLVTQGELLVSHKMLDSNNQVQQSDVEGKVYAFTFQEISVEIFKDKWPRFMQYYLCLLKSREQLHEILSEGETIVQEIPLIFEEKDDRIRMTNYYVLYEQIAVKENHE